MPTWLILIYSKNTQSVTSGWYEIHWMSSTVLLAILFLNKIVRKMWISLTRPQLGNKQSEQQLIALHLPHRCDQSHWCRLTCCDVNMTGAEDRSMCRPADFSLMSLHSSPQIWLTGKLSIHTVKLCLFVVFLAQPLFLLQGRKNA